MGKPPNSDKPAILGPAFVVEKFFCNDVPNREGFVDLENTSTGFFFLYYFFENNQNKNRT